MLTGVLPGELPCREGTRVRRLACCSAAFVSAAPVSFGSQQVQVRAWSQHRGTLDHEEGPLKEGIDKTKEVASAAADKTAEFTKATVEKTSEVASAAADKTQEVPNLLTYVSSDECRDLHARCRCVSGIQQTLTWIVESFVNRQRR